MRLLVFETKKFHFYALYRRKQSRGARIVVLCVELLLFFSMCNYVNILAESVLLKYTGIQTLRVSERFGFK